MASGGKMMATNSRTIARGASQGQRAIGGAEEKGIGISKESGEALGLGGRG
jgi:hypothetical protein